MPSMSGGCSLVWYSQEETSPSAALGESTSTMGSPQPAAISAPRASVSRATAPESRAVSANWAPCAAAPGMPTNRSPGCTSLDRSVIPVSSTPSSEPIDSSWNSETRPVSDLADGCSGRRTGGIRSANGSSFSPGGREARGRLRGRLDTIGLEHLGHDLLEGGGRRRGSPNCIRLDEADDHDVFRVLRRRHACDGDDAFRAVDAVDGKLRRSRLGGDTVAGDRQHVGEVSAGGDSLHHPDDLLRARLGDDADGLRLRLLDDGAVGQRALVHEGERQAHPVVAERLVGASKLRERRGDALPVGDVVLLLRVPVVREDAGTLALEADRGLLSK